MSSFAVLRGETIERPVLFALAAALVLSPACGGDDDDDDDDIVEVDAAAAIDAAAAMPDAAPECHSQAQEGDQIARIQVNEDPPTPTGGGVPDGHYLLVESLLYTGVRGNSGPDGASRAITSDCVSGVCEVTVTDLGQPLHRETWTLTPTDADLLMQMSCPGSTMINATHTTATDKGGTTTATIYETVPAGTIASVYELQ